jgi:hypothetical protein
MPGQIALTVPNLTTPGPAYATQISNDLTTIAAHNHDGVNNGASIDISGQVCNADLSLQHHNLSNVRSVEFDNEPAKLTGSQDVNCLYVNQGNLGFNTSDGTFVPITQGDSLAPSALSAFLSWTMRNNGVPLTANASILIGDTYNFIALNSAGGAFTVTLPIAAQITPSAVTKGRLYVFRDVNNACSTHPVTIQVTPASGNTFGDDGSTSFVLNTNGAYVAFYTDGVNLWFPWAQNAYQGEQVGLNGTVIQAKNGSGLNVDASSLITNAGQYGQNGGLFALLGSSNLIQGGATTIDGGATLTWSGGAIETYASGTTTTFQSGATLILNGGLQGTTNAGTLTIGSGGALTVSGTASFPGTTNLNGSSNISGVGNLVTGTLGLVAGTISGDPSSKITNQGTTYIYGERHNATTGLAAGTYNVDSGSAPDNFVALMLASSGNWNINMPASPTQGRRITIGDISGIAQGGAGTWIVTIIANTGDLMGLSGTAGGTATTFTVSPAIFGAAMSAFWAVTFQFVGFVWVPIMRSFTTTVTTE